MSQVTNLGVTWHLLTTGTGLFTIPPNPPLGPLIQTFLYRRQLPIDISRQWHQATAPKDRQGPASLTGPSNNGLIKIPKTLAPDPRPFMGSSLLTEEVVVLQHVVAPVLFTLEARVFLSLGIRTCQMILIIPPQNLELGAWETKA